MRRGMLGLVLLALLGLTGVPAQAVDCSPVSTYTITELEGIGSIFHITRAVAIAPDGSAAGSSLDDSLVSHAVRWDESGNATVLSSSDSEAFGISSNGSVAGWQAGRRSIQAMTWSPTRVLRLPRGATSGRAVDVNASGLAVGWTTDSIGDTDAVRWDGTRPTSLASGRGAPSISLATAVNDAGTIVGRGDFGTAPFRRALRWQGTTRSTLRTLGGGSDAATGISESGLVTGGGLSPVDSKFHAVLWQGNTITDLGLFATHPTSGYGVNDCGTVVGDTVVDLGQDIIDAVIWQNGGPAVSVESLLPPAMAGTCTPPRR
jgi:uncharacterized membrane protein